MPTLSGGWGRAPLVASAPPPDPLLRLGCRLQRRQPIARKGSCPEFSGPVAGTVLVNLLIHSWRNGGPRGHLPRVLEWMWAEARSVQFSSGPLPSPVAPYSIAPMGSGGAIRGPQSTETGALGDWRTHLQVLRSGDPGESLALPTDGPGGCPYLFSGHRGHMRVLHKHPMPGDCAPWSPSPEVHSWSLQRPGS